MTNFWRTATTEQKLAQIDAGIFLGLTAGQVAMNCGTTQPILNAFANRHGRNFGYGTEARRKSRMASEIAVIASLKSRSAYYGSSPTDSSLMHLYAPERDTGNLFDAHPLDEEVM